MFSGVVSRAIDRSNASPPEIESHQEISSPRPILVLRVENPRDPLKIRGNGVFRGFSLERRGPKISAIPRKFTAFSW